MDVVSWRTKLYYAPRRPEAVPEVKQMKILRWGVAWMNVRLPREEKVGR